LPVEAAPAAWGDKRRSPEAVNGFREINEDLPEAVNGFREINEDLPEAVCGRWEINEDLLEAVSGLSPTPV
jgi:hypothetical protein